MPRDLRETPAIIRGVVRHQLGSQATLATLPPHYGACSAILFQRWVDGNWEIYSAQGDGAGLARLTYDPAADESPHGGEHCTRITFSSDRGGNDDIFVMAGDGSGLRRVVDDAADDVFPALSPDGRTIAFQTYRHGEQPEVYLLDVATGAQTRLTNHVAYDGQPAWSPDGGRIALISDRSGAKNVWVMNRDGSGLHQVTWLRHAGAPKWSPDGRRIALASDDLGTGFTALWVVNADGSGPRLVWRPADDQSDAWPGAWSPDGRYLLHEEATWDYQDDWIVVAASLGVIAVDDPSDRQSLITGGINMSASWDVCDRLAPISQVNPLPQLASSPLTVTWGGTDNCASQIEYQLQYRPGGTWTWLDWPLAEGDGWTVQIQALFAWDRPGSVVRFRSRARDPFGQVETWPTGAGDAYAVFPATIQGLVGDNRAGPLPGAQVASPVHELPAAQADVAGRYVQQAASESEAFLQVSAAGYVGQRLTRPELDHMVGIDHYLSPAPELVTNGGFESQQAGWYASGEVSFRRVAFAYDGYCAQLGITPVESGAPSPQLYSSSYLRQMLHIPADTHAPTLGFRYALGTGQGRVGVLRAQVGTAQGETPVWESSTPTQWGATHAGTPYPLWQYAYADLSAWAGQTVTVTLAYDVSWLAGTALVDQVSVAPWFAPRITSISPNPASPGNETVLTIRGDNLAIALAPAQPPQVRLGDLPLATRLAAGDALQATVPLTVPFGIYDVWVANPAGYRGVAPGGLTLGYRTAIPFVVAVGD